MKNALKYLYLLVLLIPLVINPWGFDVFELPKVSWLAISTGALLLVTGMRLWSARKVKFNYNPYLFWYLLLLIFSFLLSSVLAIAPLEAIFGNYTRMQGVFTQLLYLLQIFIVLHLFERNFWQTLVKKLSIIGFFVSVYAVLQAIGFDPLNQNALGAFSGRSSSFLGQPNTLGQLLIIPILLSLYKLIKWRTLAQGEQLFYTANFTFCSLALLVSYNRSSILALLIGGCLIAIYFLFKKRSFKVISAGLCLLFLIAGFWYMTKDNFRSLGARAALWQSSFNAAQEHLLIGGGPASTYQQLMAHIDTDIYQYEDLYSTPDRAHNGLWETVLQRGLLGLILYLVALAVLIFYLFKKLPESARVAQIVLITSLLSLQFSFPLTAQNVWLIPFWVVFAFGFLKFRRIPINFSKLIALVVLFTGLFVTLVGSWLTIGDIRFKNAFDDYFFGADKEQAASGFTAVIADHYLIAEYPYLAIFFMADDSAAQDKIADWLANYGLLTNFNYKYYLLKDRWQPSQYAGNLALAAEKAPNYPFLWQKLGDRLYADRFYQQAITAYEQLQVYVGNFKDWDSEHQRIFRKNHPEFLQAMQRLKDSYLEIGEKEKALLLEEQGFWFLED